VGWQWSILEKIKLKQICVQKNGGDTVFLNYIHQLKVDGALASFGE